MVRIVTDCLAISTSTLYSSPSELLSLSSGILDEVIWFQTQRNRLTSTWICCSFEIIQSTGAFSYVWSPFYRCFSLDNYRVRRILLFKSIIKSRTLSVCLFGRLFVCANKFMQTSLLVQILSICLWEWVFASRYISLSFCHPKRAKKPLKGDDLQVNIYYSTYQNKWQKSLGMY